MSNYSTLFAIMVSMLIIIALTTSITAFQCSEQFAALQEAKSVIIPDIPVLGSLFAIAFDFTANMDILFNPLQSCGNGMQWVSFILIFPMGIILIFSILSFIPLVGGP